MSKLKASVEIIRPVNCFIGSITTIIAIITVNQLLELSYYPSLNLNQLFVFLILGFFTYFFIAAAGNIVNDIFDIEIDKINRPHRALPSGRLTIKEAWIQTIIYWIIGIILAFLTNLVAGIIASIFALIGFLYAAKGKLLGAFGNFMVAFSFGFGLLYGAMIVYFEVLGILFIPLVIWFYFLSAFLVLWGREVIKGIEDIEGDKIRGVQTIARKYGIKTASIVAAVFNILGIIFFTLSLVISVFGISPLPKIFYVVMYAPAVISAGISTVYILRDPYSKRNQSKASLFDKIGSLSGLIAYLLGLI
ncbi:MAG: geranylgeranylglycerol-phosphate geranylgeranyltransferase [Candidatus Odinarchaeia archaeon]